MATETESAKKLTRAEVAKNNTPDNLWMVIDHRVYDLTDFQEAHPGGNVVLAQVAGTDATSAFYNLHRHEVLQKYSSLCIGTIEGEKPEIIDPQPGDLSTVPFAEPGWLSPQYKSPYYNETHRALRRELRVFVDKYVTPEAQAKEADGTYISQELINRMAETNVLAMRLGPGKHLHGRKLLGGVKGEEFDYFHDLVTAQELSRKNARGFQDGNMAGMMISLTAVRQWLNNAALKEQVTKECLSGEKKICLAITGKSTVRDRGDWTNSNRGFRGLRRGWSQDHDREDERRQALHHQRHEEVDNERHVLGLLRRRRPARRWQGLDGGALPKTDAVDAKRIKTSYSTAAGTAYLQFENAKVPVDHLLGEENKGIYVILSNFNHERWAMTAFSCRAIRTVTEECLKWSHQRIVFGKPLINQAAIRQKLARMISITEACQAWIENITYQMNNMTYAEQSKHLGGPIGLLKSFVTQCMGEVASHAMNIFGGRGLTQSGMGRIVEEFHRTYKFDAIL
ncbi:hypothetical protein MRB53_040871 [Persea americana]|nr:hypothetical protein MRB53_040871 [Persea americana]